jgi:hypothetical protein
MKYHIPISSDHKCGIKEQNMKKDKNLAGRMIYIIATENINLIQ